MKKIADYIRRQLSRFDKSIPAMQRVMYEEILAELKRLDVRSGRIAVTVRNLSIVDSIKRKLNRLILNDEYKAQVREFARAFNEITKLQNEYWRTIEPQFKPRPLLKAIRNQAIDDVVRNMTTGVSATISDQLTSILRTNITAGGSYADLVGQMREALTNTPETKGILDRSVRTVTQTSINQYNRQYTNIVASDLGYVWFLYANTEINTSRPFCQAMVENHRYFHISQVPDLLEGKYLGQRMRYKDNKTGEEKTVEIYAKTGLPDGFIAGTNVDNFFTNAGGWNCGHSINPLAERQVPVAIREAVYATAAYKRWARAQ
jgi:hypothetical protein